MAASLPQAVLAARREFSQARAVPGELLPAPILRSWERCAGFGFDMEAVPRVEPVSEPELRALRERHALLQRICRPELEALRAEASSSESVVILTDATGVVLERVGSVDFAARATRVALSPGVPWREAVTGTNAIGTALVERRSVEVRGAEHYFAPHQFLSCSAAPILDPRGELIAILDLSGPATTHHPYALSLVRLAVEQIEFRLFHASLKDCDLVRFHSDPALIGTPREGLLAFRDHRLVGANRHGLSLLGVTAEAIDTRRFGDLFANGFARLAERCRLRAHGGHEFHAHVRRPAASAQHSAPTVTAPRRDTEPWLDAPLETACARAVRLLDAEVPVLLQGETGVGKEVLARQVHARSTRAGGRFVAVNCAALPESLIEAELFGYVDGAFTGARRQGAPGLLREADGGVLFLDEIGDMPIALQARLLRVLQDRAVTPVGGTRPLSVDFALICATHRDLREMVAQGAFRADLYFRLAQYTFTLPPLRERDNRSAIIAELWARIFGDTTSLPPEILTRLAAYQWVGNFRQLVSTLRALQALAEPGQPLTPELLPAEIRENASAAAERAQAGLAEITREAMRQALARAGGNVSRAAKELGINRSTLYRRLLSE